MQVNLSLFRVIRNIMMSWSSILLPCSLTTNSYPTTSDRWQFQECAMLCHSCYRFFLALLLSRMIFPCLSLKTPSKPSTNIFLQEASSETSCFSLDLQNKKQVQMSLELIAFSFGKLLAQQVLVIPLKNRLMWRPIIVCCSFITRPCSYRIVHCYIVTSRAPPFINIKTVSGARSHGLTNPTISGLGRPPHYTACGSATSLLRNLSATNLFYI